jgi:hypothetical protein
VCYAKAPVFLVITRHVWNGIGHFGYVMQMRLQFAPANALIDGSRVANYMKVVGIELGNLPSVGTYYVSVLDIPLVGNGPVEHGCSAGYFMLDEWNDLLKNIHRLAQAVARKAPTYGPKAIEVMLKVFR